MRLNCGVCVVFVNCQVMGGDICYYGRYFCSKCLIPYLSWSTNLHRDLFNLLSLWMKSSTCNLFKDDVSFCYIRTANTFYTSQNGLKSCDFLRTVPT